LIDRDTVYRLRVLARRALSRAPSPWHSVGSAVVCKAPPGLGADSDDLRYYGGGRLVGESMDEPVALFISECDPGTIISLCEAVESLTWQAAEKCLLPGRTA